MEQVGRRQAVLLGINYILAPSLVIIPAQMILTAGQDAWMAFIPALAASGLALWALCAVMSRFPDQQDLAAALVSRHPVAGRAVLIGFASFYWLIHCRDIRMIADFVNIALLPRTPVPFIALLIALTTAEITRSGREVIARMTELFGLILIVITLMTPLLTAANFHFRYLQPVLENGAGPPLVAGWYFLSYVGEIVALPFILSRRSFRLKEGLTGLVAGTLLIAMVMAMTVLVLGPRLGGRFLYPINALIRHIRITDFLDRFDLVLVSLWMPAILVKLAYSLYVVCHLLARVWPVLSVKRTVWPVGLTALGGALWLFASNLEVYNFHFGWPTWSVLFQVGIPVLLALTVWPRRRAPDLSGGGSGSPSPRGAAGG